MAFGPYAALEPGSYHLMVYGSATAAPTARVDVVSGRNAVQLAAFPVGYGSSDQPGILTSATIQVASSMQDVQVRLHVGEHDVITVTGYSLIPVSR